MSLQLQHVGRGPISTVIYAVYFAASCTPIGGPQKGKIDGGLRSFLPGTQAKTIFMKQMNLI